MSLLDDTVIDARRPRVLRRNVDQRVLAATDEAALFAGDDAPSSEHAYAHDVSWPATRVAREAGAASDGHQASLAREMGAPRDDDRDDFRREGQSMSREASYPSGSGMRRLPTGDPLSAGMGAEGPKSSAKNVGFPDVTVMGDSRTSELATGPEKGRSPGKVAAAAAGSESMALQSDVLPGSSEAEWFRARSLSMTPEGSTTMVSADGETFLSRPPGRGAPSETPHSVSVTTPATRPAATPHGNAGAPPEGASTGAAGAVEAADSIGSDDAAAALHRPGTARAGRTPGPAGPLAAPRRSPALAFPALPDPPRQRFATGARAADAHDATPTLSIGRIDVTVVSDTVATVPAAAASLPQAFGDAGVSDFLACNYLKRL